MDTANFDINGYLGRLPIFQALNSDELARLASGCRVRRMTRGEAVFHVGDPCEEFHVVVGGQVKIFAISPSGQEKVIELVGPGHSFAEALMFSGKPYIVSAQALTETLLLTIAKAAVLAEIESSPRVALRMLAGLSGRLHGLVQDVEAYSLHSGMQRVIGYLLRDVPDAGPSQAAEPVQVLLPVSKATIASRLSLTPEYFSRVLHELEAHRMIEVDGREIRILDAGKLSRFMAR